MLHYFSHFIPISCTLCCRYHYHSEAVCASCCSLFKILTRGCVVCCQPLDHASDTLCGHCIRQKPAFDKVFSRYAYEEPLRTVLHMYKYRQALYLRDFITKLFLDALPNADYRSNCLIPVPLHPRRMRQRGFNQSAELAKLLSKKIQVPYDITLCRKIINTEAQAHLNRKQRQRNVHQAFYVKKTTHRHVTLVDDLLTTGSTAHEIAKALKHQGVEQVDIWCCARTI